MAHRAMVRGEITKPEAVRFIFFCLLLMIVSVAQLRPICIKLLPVAAIPFIIYPFTKRFTGWCHLFLGLAIAMAPAGGWVAAGGDINLPMILLCTSVALWIGAFDAMYGAQDEAFDKSQKLCILCFIAVGFLLSLHWPYYMGVMIAALTLVYQHSIIGPHDFSRVTQVYFLRNGIVSVAICLCAWFSYWM